MNVSRMLSLLLTSWLASGVSKAAAAADANLPLAGLLDCTAAEGCGDSDALCTLQLASQRTKADAVAASASRRLRVAHDVDVSLQSRFQVGPFPRRVSCDTAELSMVFSSKSWKASLASSFGAGGGGASWQTEGLVVEGPLPSEVDLREPVQLELQVVPTKEAYSKPGVFYVGGLEGEVPSNESWSRRGGEECPPAYCLMQAPTGASVPGQSASRPPCGWGPTLPNASAPTPSTGSGVELVAVDVTPLFAAGFKVFRVWVGPSELTERGMWQTPVYNVTSWGFAWTQKAKAD